MSVGRGDMGIIKYGGGIDGYDVEMLITHTCQPCEEAMGTYWIQGRGGMDRAKFGGQSKSATRRIAWSDGEVWMRQREVSVGECGWVCRWVGVDRSSGLVGECGRDSAR